MLRRRTRVVVAVATVLIASLALAGATLAQSEAPEGTVPFVTFDGQTFYVDPENLPEGYDQEFVDQLSQLDQEAREQALEDRFKEIVNQDPQLMGGGSSLTGPCGGFAYSFDDNGVLIDAAFDAGTDSAPVSLMGGGQAFTGDNPFKVHNNGKVIYFGFVTPPPENHEWSIAVSFWGRDITVDEGGHPNTGLHNRNMGTVDLGQDFPLKLNFTAKISGNFESANGVVCNGSGWVEVTGENSVVVSVIAAVAALAGFAGVLFNARPARTWKG